MMDLGRQSEAVRRGRETVANVPDFHAKVSKPAPLREGRKLEIRTCPHLLTDLPFQCREKARVYLSICAPHAFSRWTES